MKQLKFERGQDQPLAEACFDKNYLTLVFFTSDQAKLFANRLFAIKRLSEEDGSDTLNFSHSGGSTVTIRKRPDHACNFITFTQLIPQDIFSKLKAACEELMKPNEQAPLLANRR